MFNTRELLPRRKSSELGYIFHSAFAICAFAVNIIIFAHFLLDFQWC